MYPTQLHSYLLWRSTVEPDPQALASRRYTAAVSLLPALMVGIFVFGWWAGWVVLLSVASAAATDTIIHRFVYRDSSGTRDGTWLLTGMLLAMLLPPNAPWWLPVIGAVLAVFFGKYYLSVDNMPLLQPATLGLLLLVLLGLCAGVFTGRNPTLGTRDGQPEWPVLTHGLQEQSFRTQAEEGSVGWSIRNMLRDFFGGDIRKAISREQYHLAISEGKTPLFDAQAEVPAQAVYQPRPLDQVKMKSGFPVKKTRDGVRGTRSSDMILGYVPATIGGSSALALGFGILLLVFSGAASWVLPVCALMTMLALLNLLAWLYGGSADARVITSNIPIHLLTGSTLLAIFYMAADPATMPRSFLGKVYAGVAVGALEVLLRIFTPLSEGIFLSVVLVQASAIVIDQWLAPPLEKPRSSPHAGLSSSSLGRL